MKSWMRNGERDMKKKGKNIEDKRKNERRVIRKMNKQ